MGKGKRRKQIKGGGGALSDHPELTRHPIDAPGGLPAQRGTADLFGAAGLEPATEPEKPPEPEQFRFKFGGFINNPE